VTVLVKPSHADINSLSGRISDVLGPGLITGASDDDPSGIATYFAGGRSYQFSYAIGWTILLAYPLMCAIQMISAPDRGA
jgi:Mn2+/Fe2+ NRAMP family transporter